MADWAFADSYYIILTIFFIYFFQVCLMINKKYLVSHLLGKKNYKARAPCKKPSNPIPDHFWSTSSPLPDRESRSTSRPLPVHFLSSSSSLGHTKWLYELWGVPKFNWIKKLYFANYAERRTNEYKKGTSKDPFRIYARDLKIPVLVKPLY